MKSASKRFSRPNIQCKCILALIVLTTAAAFSAEPSDAIAPSGEPTTCPSRIVAATVYQGTALVTREVSVPAGTGLMDLLVTPLPEQVENTSLYTEGSDGLRVLSTRFRTRAVQEDTSDAVRARRDQIKLLTDDSEKITHQIAAADLNLGLLAKLENFTGATMATMTDKGALNSDATIALAKFIITTREQTDAQQVTLRQKLAANSAQVDFLQRQLTELTAGSAQTQRDAIITVDKTAPGADLKVRLNYLVAATGWTPQYKLHAGVDQDKKVHVEYLASIQQQSGEDWGNADISLSTAQPMLNAAPLDLLALELEVGITPPQGMGQVQPNFDGNYAANDIALQRANKAHELRQQAQKEDNGNNSDQAKSYFNAAGAEEQSAELLNPLSLDAQKDAQRQSAYRQDGPSVTFHLPVHYSIPSKSDQQLIEVARLDLTPDYFYKAVPVLTPHVYRLATMNNDSGYVLLPGLATMYVGNDFVGRMNLPLVAMGESVSVGFGIDPQLQVERTLVSKTESIQGGNQVHVYAFRIRISNFKPEKVAIQVWDRLPKANNESVGVTLLSQSPDLSPDPQYTREDRPKNLLRWDVTVDKDQTGEKAFTLDYQFKMEYAKNVSIQNLQSK